MLCDWCQTIAQAGVNVDELVETIQSANIPLIVSETFSPHRAQELLQA